MLGNRLVSISGLLLLGAIGIACFGIPWQPEQGFGFNGLKLVNLNDPVDATFYMLEDGAQKVKRKGVKADIVLVVGNTGSGKSTLVTILAFGNQSTLVSEKIGRGNFIIKDTNSDRIGGMTLTSKTLYPELIHSKVDDIDYYDCPGFADTRGMAEDIAATYFTKLVVDSAEAVKILVTATYSGLKPGGSRTDLSSLIDHVSEFIKDVPKYNQSIALIATKVENILDEDTRDYLPDQDIIQDIGDFIKNEGGTYATDKLKNPEATEEELDLYRNAVAFIDAITTQDEHGNYNRIGIFRTPRGEGSLNDMTMIQEGNDNNRNIIKNVVTYQPKENSDFGYSISDKTRAGLPKFGNKILERITSSFSDITSSIQKQLKEDMKNSEDWKTTLKTLESGQDEMKKTSDELNLEKTRGNPTKYIDSFGQCASKLGDFSESTFSKLNTLGGYLKFLQDVSSDTALMNNIQDPFENLKAEYSKSINWYTFLTYTQSTLSKYNYQNDTSKFNVAELSDWGNPGKPQGISVTEINLAKFSKLVEFSGGSPDASDGDRLNDLKELLKNLLHRPDAKSVANEKKDKLTIAGSFVQISKLKKEILSNAFEQIQIFGLNRIFIDDSLDLPGVSISLMAPVIEAIGKQKINLDGKPNLETFNETDYARPGQNETEIDETNINEMPNNGTKLNITKDAHPGQNGIDGLPGKPGGNGGNLLAVYGKRFIGQENLEITANGGKGGSGQDGQNGGKGTNGTEPKFPTNDLLKNRTYYNKYPVGEEFKDWNYTGWEFYGIFGGSKDKHSFRLFGGKGAEGKAGGDGGAGGKGGYGGLIQILSSDGKINSEKKGKEGQVGTPGVGGKGGTGGLDGRDRLVKFVNEIKLFSSYEYFEGRDKFYDDRVKKYDDGKNGTTGGNSQNIQEPAVSFPRNEWAKHFNYFKQYLREYAIDPQVKSDLITFISDIESNPRLNALYGAIELLDDLIGLENQYFSLYKKLDLLSYYESLVNRTQTFGKELSTKPDVEEEKKGRNKALAYLLTSAMGKISAMKQGLEKNLIIDLKEYIDKLALKNIEELKTAKKNVAIKKHRNNYYNSVKGDIDEATEFITKDMKPAIDSAIAEMDKETLNLVEETKKLTKKTEASKKELEEKQAALRKNMIANAIFGYYKIVGAVASCLGPEGVAFGAIVGAATSIVQPFVLDDKANSDSKPRNIPDGVKNGVAALSKLYKEKTEEKAKALKSQIEYITEMGKESPQKLEDLNEKIKIIGKQLSAAENNGTDTPEQKAIVDSLQNEFKKLFDAKKVTLQKEAKNEDTTSKELLKKFEKAEKIINVGSVSVEVFNKFQKDQDAIALAGDAVVDAENEITRLHEFEASIYSVLVPMLRGMNDNVKDMEGTLGTKSLVGLDVAKWKIQSTLKTLLAKIQTMTSGFDVEEKFVQAIDKLKEALVTLINIYDRIQSLKDKQELADYIANIGSAGSAKIELDINSPYKKYVDELDQIIQSNLILLEFEQIISAFLQWVFPFADIHKDTFYLPPTLGLNSTIDQLVTNAVEKINAIKTYLDLDQTTIGNYDKYIERGPFYNNSAFYKWSDQEFHEEISNGLLQGDRITLNADITKRKPMESAIKFSKVNLVLTLSSANESLQNEFTEFLNDYKVILTHTGNSYYEYGGKVYLIDTKEQVFSHSFKKNAKGEPETVDDVYGKILNGDLLLSPYCFWTIQLAKRTKGPIEDFSKFTKFGVDAELIGEGKFVIEEYKGAKLPPLHLDKYYILMNSANSN